MISLKKTITVEICDLCGKETEIYEKISVPTYRTFDANDGQLHYSKKHFYSEQLDLCEKCLEKISVVHSIGVQCEKYEYKG